MLSSPVKLVRAELEEIERLPPMECRLSKPVKLARAELEEIER